MPSAERLIAKLADENRIFTWHELVSLMRMLGYRQEEGSGSRVKFDNGNREALINLHRPHPGNEIKRYARRQILEKLKTGGLI